VKPPFGCHCHRCRDRRRLACHRGIVNFDRWLLNHFLASVTLALALFVGLLLASAAFWSHMLAP
jgi:hypothetical protein